jgi:hypothetical protein
MPPDPDETMLPPYLRECPTDPEAIPLQVQLLTYELANLRLAMVKLARLHLALAQTLEPAPPIDKAPDNGD